MSKLAASLIALGGAVGQAFVQSATGQPVQATQRRRKKGGCTPCEAMANVRRHQSKVNNVGK